MKLGKRNLIFSIIAGVVALAAIIACVIIVKSNYTSNSNGKITVEVIDIDYSLVREGKISFKKGDTLVKLLEKNFNNVIFEDGMIMEIETLVTPSNWSSYICIRVNGEDSSVGITQIKFKDGDKISFIMVTNPYATN